MGEDQEKDRGSGAVVKMGRVIESYERREWVCSFENDGMFGVRSFRTVLRYHGILKARWQIASVSRLFKIYSPDPNNLPVGFVIMTAASGALKDPEPQVSFSCLRDIARKMNEKPEQGNFFGNLASRFN